jgi:hypothetical protein
MYIYITSLVISAKKLPFKILSDFKNISRNRLCPIYTKI